MSDHPSQDVLTARWLPPSATPPLKAVKFVRNVFPFGVGEIVWFREKHANAYVKSGSAVLASKARVLVTSAEPEIEPSPEAA